MKGGSGSVTEGKPFYAVVAVCLLQETKVYVFYCFWLKRVKSHSKSKIKCLNNILHIKN